MKCASIVPLVAGLFLAVVHGEFSLQSQLTTYSNTLLDQTVYVLPTSDPSVTQAETTHTRVSLSSLLSTASAGAVPQALTSSLQTRPTSDDQEVASATSTEAVQSLNAMTSTPPSSSVASRICSPPHTEWASQINTVTYYRTVTREVLLTHTVVVYPNVSQAAHSTSLERTLTTPAITHGVNSMNLVSASTTLEYTPSSPASIVQLASFSQRNVTTSVEVTAGFSSLRHSVLGLQTGQLPPVETSHLSSSTALGATRCTVHESSTAFTPISLATPVGASGSNLTEAPKSTKSAVATSQLKNPSVTYQCAAVNSDDRILLCAQNQGSTASMCSRGLLIITIYSCLTLMIL